MDLRKEAKGRQCQIRIPGVCSGNSETVVLCHLNQKSLFGVGMGQKVPDIFGAWGCGDCHGAVDCGNVIHTPYGWIELAEINVLFYEGVFRTQNILLKEGKL